jgi:hypothetical protein
LASLHTGFTSITSVPHFSGGPVLAVLLLLFIHFACVPAVVVGHAMVTSLLLIVAGANAVACVIAVAYIPIVAGISDVASVSLVPALLTVAGVPAVDGGGAVARFPADSGIPYSSWCLYILYCTVYNKIY